MAKPVLYTPFGINCVYVMTKSVYMMTKSVYMRQQSVYMRQKYIPKGVYRTGLGIYIFFISEFRRPIFVIKTVISEFCSKESTVTALCEAISWVAKQGRERGESGAREGRAGSKSNERERKRG